MRSQIEQTTRSVVVHYQGFRAAIIGEYYKATQLSIAGRPSPLAFSETIQSHVFSFYDNINAAIYNSSITGRVTESLQSIAGLNLLETDPPSEDAENALYEYLTNREDSISDSIETVGRENAEEVLRSYRHYLMGMSELMPSEIKTIMLHRDMSNRKIDAKTHVESTVRSGLYDMINTSSVFLLMEAGETEGRIDRVDHDQDGYIFPLSQYNEMQREYFHPNAGSLVVYK